MAPATDRVREMYNELAFGEFCYAGARAGYYPLIDEFIGLMEPGSRVCDAGCGVGFWLDEMVRRGLRDDQLVGIDLAPSHAQQARARGHRAVCGSVLALAFPAGAFDFVFCAGVIHHTPDPSAALRELARVTRKGGYVYLAVYNKWHPYFWFVHKMTAPVRALHWRGWTRLSQLAYAGWKLCVQPISLAVYGRPLDEKTCRALFMDQVITPYAHLFTPSGVTREADAAGMDVLHSAKALRSLMLVSILRVRG